MKLSHLRNQRGGALLLTTILVVPLMLILAGLATDLGFYGDVDAELQRALDASALAGAGQLGFNVDRFPAARAAAFQYAQINRPRIVPEINLDLNTPNAPGGDIVLGIWDPVARTFTPSDNGNFVNAVKTRHRTTVPTAFLRYIGMTSLNAGATATAWAPPASVPPTCAMPIGLTDGVFGCDDVDGTPGPDSGGSFGNTCGCGKPVRFITSSKASQIGTNVPTWTTMTGCGGPNPNESQNPVDAAAIGECQASPLKTGDYIDTQGGLIQPWFDRIVYHFPIKFSGSEYYEVFQNDSQGNPARTYYGKGWSTVVPLISTTGVTVTCPTASTTLFSGTLVASLRSGLKCLLPSVQKAFADGPNQNGGGGGNQNQKHVITGWTTFLMTQVITQGRCLVNNQDDPGNSPLWPPQGSNSVPCGSRLPQAGDSTLLEIYGYYKCERFDTPGGNTPGPTSSLGRPKLVL